MAYIFPSGEILIYRGVPLSPNYSDVLCPSSENDLRAQLAMGYETRRYSKESYTRQETGALRIRENPDTIVEFNYLTFTNLFNGGTKTFFCFITSVNYINNNCAEIEFIIDDFMTWFHVLQLGQCFVEREIPETDELYENLVPEDIETGDYINNKLDTYDFGADPYYLIETTTDTLGNPICGAVSGFACPINFLKIPVSASPQTLYNLIKFWIDPEESYSRATYEDIITIQIVPHKLALAAVPDDPNDKGQAFFDYIEITREMTLDQYTPKNKKLLTDPFTYIVVSNNSGSSKKYKWELLTASGEDYLRFEIAGTCLGTPTIACFPEGYKSVFENTDEAIYLTNFPPVPWNCDTYKAYLAQNKASIMTSILCGAVSLLPNAFTSSISSAVGSAFGSTVVSANSQNITGRSTIGAGATMAKSATSGTSINSSGVLGGVGQIAQTLAKVHDAQFMPVTIANVANGDMLSLLLDRYKFSFYQVSIKREMAKLIDDYFSAYGYAQHKIKTPNINSRPYWNYTKTKGCILLGAAPAQAKANIINAMDNGVRFWKRLQDIGNFSLPNNI